MDLIINVWRDLKVPLACLAGSFSLSVINEIVSTLAVTATLVYTVIKIVKELRARKEK